jgi:hypothetical protein
MFLRRNSTRRKASRWVFGCSRISLGSAPSRPWSRVFPAKARAEVDRREVLKKNVGGAKCSTPTSLASVKPKLYNNMIHGPNSARVGNAERKDGGMSEGNHPAAGWPSGSFIRALILFLLERSRDADFLVHPFAQVDHLASARTERREFSRQPLAGFPAGGTFGLDVFHGEKL